MLALKTVAAKLRNREFTPSQVAAIFGMEMPQVNNLIDEVAPIGVASVGVGRRAVQYKGLMPMLLAQDFIDWGLKRDLRQRALARSLKTTGKNVSVPGTSLSVLVQRHRTAVARAVRALYEAEGAVVSKPEILQGEPCIAGTRIPAYLIADIVEDAGVAEARKLYRQLSVRQLEQAYLYSKANPRRGRPKQLKLPPRSKARGKKTVVIR